MEKKGSKSDKALERFESEEYADKQRKPPFIVKGDIGNDLQYLSDKLKMDEEEVVAFGLGILLKAYRVKGEIRIIDEDGGTSYRSRRLR